MQIEIKRGPEFEPYGVVSILRLMNSQHSAWEIVIMNFFFTLFTLHGRLVTYLSISQPFGYQELNDKRKLIYTISTSTNFPDRKLKKTTHLQNWLRYGGWVLGLWKKHWCKQLFSTWLLQGPALLLSSLTFPAHPRWLFIPQWFVHSLHLRLKTDIISCY